MVQKIHPRVVIWVPSSSPPAVILGLSKQPMRRPSIKKSVDDQAIKIHSCLATEVCYKNCADFFPTIISHHCHTKTKTLMNNTFFESPWDDLFTLVFVFQCCDPPKFAWIPPGLAIVAGRREIESIRTTNNIWQSAGLQTRKEKKA